MDWDIIFSVKNWPEDRRIQGSWIATFRLPIAEEDKLIHAECLPMQAKRFFMGVKPGALAITCIRVDNADTYREAVLLAKDTLRLALDGLAIVPSETKPNIGPLIGYRNRESNEVKYIETMVEGFASLTPRNGNKSGNSWKMRNQLILYELNHFSQKDHRRWDDSQLQMDYLRLKLHLVTLVNKLMNFSKKLTTT